MSLRMHRAMNRIHETAPPALRIENPSKFWSVTFPHFVGPVLAILIVAELILAVFTINRAANANRHIAANADALVALIVQGAVVVGIVTVLLQAARRRQVASIEFGDRFRFFERGHPIAYDWDQIAGFWYEGVRNPARVKVTAVRPNQSDDRILVVGVRWGPEIRLRVSPVDQVQILAWAQYVERCRDVGSQRDPSATNTR